MKFNEATIKLLDKFLDDVTADWQQVDGFEFDGVIVPSRALKVAAEALRTEIHKHAEGSSC